MASPFALSVWTDARPDPGEKAGQRYQELLEEARFADTLGFRAFCTTEQHAVDDGYLGAQLTALAGIGSATWNLRLFSNCVLLPFYAWRQVVEQAVAVDLLSGGRLDLGVAAGGFAREFELFGVDIHARGRLMEEGIPFLREGLSDGRLPDGPGGSFLPVTPRPVQDHIPILVGGNSVAAIDRAVRLADGTTLPDFDRPEKNFPALWRDAIQPALQRHGRSPDDFRFVACVAMWVSDDPEKDWKTLFEPAFLYQQGKYAEWAGGEMEAGYATSEDLDMRDHLVGTPEDIAQRLLAMQREAPFQELVFWYRLPGIPHDRAMQHMELVSSRLMPLLG